MVKLNKENSQHSVILMKVGDFSEFSLFKISSKDTLNSEKYPIFANRLANWPFLGLVCLGGLQLGETVKSLAFWG